MRSSFLWLYEGRYWSQISFDRHKFSKLWLVYAHCWKIARKPFEHLAFFFVGENSILPESGGFLRWPSPSTLFTNSQRVFSKESLERHLMNALKNSTRASIFRLFACQSVLDSWLCFATEWCRFKRHQFSVHRMEDIFGFRSAAEPYSPLYAFKSFKIKFRTVSKKREGLPSFTVKWSAKRRCTECSSNRQLFAVESGLCCESGKQ